MKCIELEVESKGCPSCVRTIIPHLLKIKGVRGVRTIRNKVYVIIEDHVEPGVIVNNSEIRDFYIIRSWSIHNDTDRCSEKSVFKLTGL